jgi:hypothetical protein
MEIVEIDDLTWDASRLTRSWLTRRYETSYITKAALPDYCGWIVRARDVKAVAGTIVVKIKNDKMKIKLWLTAPRNPGVGAALLRTAIQEARRRELHRIVATIDANALTHFQTYLLLGFVPVDATAKGSGVNKMELVF